MFLTYFRMAISYGFIGSFVSIINNSSTVALIPSTYYYNCSCFSIKSKMPFYWASCELSYKLNYLEYLAYLFYKVDTMEQLWDMFFKDEQSLRLHFSISPRRFSHTLSYFYFDNTSFNSSAANSAFNPFCYFSSFMYQFGCLYSSTLSSSHF